ncbi:lipocalin family protein [Marinobacter subterrani]|uniref:Outer membrane lipoprotein Blc n=1 Tax=Marinobacter subterrani TaxID=1658765 RepID=A0A0J7J912_9GAMM|nr:lipocalin family protein [Marinobacter subterrani]KMQ74667.1 Bacterial lipocalin [Marinobacter subterrani]
MHVVKNWFLLVILAVLGGCTGVPEGINPVTGFNAERYLGTWYEIARLDHSFERGLSNVRAEYSRNDDGSIKVINRGYNAEEGQWDVADGRAVFVGDENTGHLKVSFFGPFYASYVVFQLDKEAYSYAYVTGYNRDYLWFLSRTPEVSEEAIEAFKARARAEEFDLEELIMVEQDRALSP